MKILIYMLTSPSGKSYIGQTRRKLAKRLRQHASMPHCSVLHAAIKKYGIESFKTEILLEVPCVLANDAEARLIRTYKTLSPNGYNLLPGGGAGTPVSEEARANYSAASLARWSDPEFRERLTLRQRVAQGRPEVRAATSAKSKERWADPDFQARRAERWADPELRAALSEAARKQWADPDYRKRMSDARRGRIASPETRMKMADSQRARRDAAAETSRKLWATPEFRARWLASRAKTKKEKTECPTKNQ